MKEGRKQHKSPKARLSRMTLEACTPDDARDIHFDDAHGRTKKALKENR
jgi:hypothetical protein